MKPIDERRTSARSAPATSGWAPIATLRPGHEITIVNVGAGGLLVRTQTRVLPGKRVELQLAGERGRHFAAGRVLRCSLVALSPVCYEAAIVLEGDFRTALRD